MNREIKFRAWNKRWKRMFDIETINHLESDSDDDEYKYVSGFANGVVQWKDVEILQFTGLLDKNGIKIYEGDILVWKSDYSDHQDYAKVYWDEETAGFDWTAKDIAMNFVKSAAKKFEVIGNIYENPELIIKK